MSIIEDPNQINSPRFGHTLTLLHRGKDSPKAILFGGITIYITIGATGISGHFAINSDTFIYHIKNEKWDKLNCI